MRGEDDIVAIDGDEALSSHEMRAVILAIAGLAVAGATALADAPGVETEALGHLDRGVAAYRAGDYALAERELHAAQTLVPDRANPYRWLALTESALGECQPALVDIESFLSRIPADDPRVAEMVQLREHCIVELHAQHAPPPAAAAPATEATPITHRWWLWTAVGVVAVAAGVTTYALVHDPGPATLPSVTCGTTGCAR
ncbi:MAG: hypothetical protein JO257_27475 [Deltaproteobacteria bacterium]|nr:hypothetical protein [Deltaproteobacteria bacterium]